MVTRMFPRGRWGRGGWTWRSPPLFSTRDFWSLIHRRFQIPPPSSGVIAFPLDGDECGPSTLLVNHMSSIDY